MISVTYPVNDTEKIQLAGPAEANFIRLEEAYDLKVLTRNPGIILQSHKADQIKLATEVLDRLRGTIQVKSQIGEGTRFICLLPSTPQP